MNSSYFGAFQLLFCLILIYLSSDPFVVHEGVNCSNTSSCCHKLCRDRSPPCGYRCLHPIGRTSPYSFQHRQHSNDVNEVVEEIRRRIGRQISKSTISIITFAMASRPLFERMKKRMEVLGEAAAGDIGYDGWFGARFIIGSYSIWMRRNWRHRCWI